MRRQYIYFLFLLLTASSLCSCEKEIGELTEYEAPRLVINALVTAQAESQIVHLRMTGPLRTEYVNDATVSIRCNDQPFCEYVTDGDAPAYALPTTDFQPGDKVSIDVQKDQHHAYAMAEVPAPVIITGLDTTTVKAKRYKWSHDYTPHTRYLVHLRLPEGTRSDDLLYFRAEVFKDILTVSSASVDGNVVSNVNLKTDEDHTQFSYWGDPALTETENADQENMSVQFDWLDGIQNIYHVFRSNYFVDGEYTLRLDLPEPYSYYTKWGYAQDVRIRIYAISRTEYNYLQALAALKTLDSGTIYDSEPGVTTNITGGAGIFCVESMTEVSFHENRNLIKVGDNYNQHYQQ